MKTYKCPKCKGLGETSREVEVIEIPYRGELHKVAGQTKVTICEHCYGKKELDWIENIIGVKVATYDKNLDPWYAPSGVTRGHIHVMAAGGGGKSKLSESIFKKAKDLLKK